jgi:FkbM family methyltransferase
MFLHELGSPDIDALPDFFLKSKDHLRHLISLPGSSIRSVDGKTIITLLGIDCYPTNKEEIFILHEIFWSGIYNFLSSRPCIIIDIGMNVGFSSLFFASKTSVAKVIGYEPFLPTYQRALENFQLNPTLYQKIVPVNLGIGTRDERKSFAYCEDRKGSVSITDDPHFRPREGMRVTQEEITIMAADKLFRKIRSDYSGLQIVCKMDCEGAEYDIFQGLSEFGGDQLPHAFMIEWHYKGNQTIVDFLTRRNYEVFSLTHDNQDLGMIYAVKAY